jgi:hypothetical protein
VDCTVQFTLKGLKRKREKEKKQRHTQRVNIFFLG